MNTNPRRPFLDNRNPPLYKPPFPLLRSIRQTLDLLGNPSSRSMASRTLEITLISAKDLKDVNLFSKMEVYAVVSIDGDRRTAQRTTADRNGGTNPSWNATIRVPLPADDPSRHVVHVTLRAERALGDRDVGEVHIPLKEFFSGSGDAKTPQFISYQVRKPSSGKAKGVLNLSFKISDSVAPAPVPPVAPPSASKAGGYPPAYPPATSYPSYPPPASAYPPPPSNPNDHAAAYPPPPKGSKPDEPVTAYPAGPSAYPAPGVAAAAPYAYPQGYPPYAQPGYGYLPPLPPAGYGYGAPPQRVRLRRCPTTEAPKKKNNLGMGLGAGLSEALPGGLLIGDMISDAGDYDAGYDAGFDDGAGFDF
ncbi:hypothetical protein J5N97_018215 [Dioscorea zingiberensis]|uniref:C2 domain-containing protein n=1 Tax=Dioscorea zingiberensis TaxID=325984 RepID=A0A9D5CMW4_9LILI|nr:hypothetical protein J5N97_018215 [Dioscorea zingiberensis]